MERYGIDASRYPAAARINGAEYVPGISFFFRIDAPMCNSPFPAMIAPNTYAAGRIAGERWNAAGESDISSTVTRINPPSQTGNVNVGRGMKGNRARIARTVGL